MRLTILFLFISFISQAQTPAFKATFEANTILADVGTAHIEISGGGTVTVIPTIDPDIKNSSNYCIENSTHEGGISRAEYTMLDAISTEEQTHIFSFKRYYPSTFYDGVDLQWLVLTQFKTYPCSKNGGWSTEICGNGGIFDDVVWTVDSLQMFRLRANPDCYEYTEPFSLRFDEWVQYSFEIYWTNTTNGYYKLWINDALVYEKKGIKTMFDNWVNDGSCDINYGFGTYSYWLTTGATDLTTYVDDIYVYNKADGATIKTVCPNCETSNFNIDGNYIQVNGVNKVIEL